MDYLISELQPHTLVNIPDFLVIQEIPKAKRVQIVCGSQWVGWNELKGKIQHLKSIIQPEVFALHSFWEWETRKNRHALGQALLSSKRSLATDSRDKIYALLGLTSDGGDIVPAPNYLSSPASVYLQAFRGILSREPEFAYLGMPDMVLGQDPGAQSPVPALDWTKYDQAITQWLMHALNKKYKEGKSEGWDSFSSIPFGDRLVLTQNHKRMAYKGSKDNLPRLLTNGIHTRVYLLDSIGSIATSFHKTHSTNLKQSKSTMYRQSGRPQGSNASNALDMLCRSIFSAICLNGGTLRYGGSGGLNAVTLPDVLAAASEKSKWKVIHDPASPDDHLSNWLFENQDLVFCGDTLKKLIEMHISSRDIDFQLADRIRDKIGDKVVGLAISLIALHSFRIADYHRTTWSTETSKYAQNKLISAINVAAGAKMKLVVGRSRQIPGLVPMVAEKGDFIVLLPHSNLPIILRPTGESSAKFIRESGIYIYAPPVNRISPVDDFQYFDSEARSKIGSIGIKAVMCGGR